MGQSWTKCILESYFPFLFIIVFCLLFAWFLYCVCFLFDCFLFDCFFVWCFLKVFFVRFGLLLFLLLCVVGFVEDFFLVSLNLFINLFVIYTFNNTLKRCLFFNRR